MHLLAAQPGAITDGEEAVDLGQTPGEMVYISAADTELALLADASRQLMAEGQNLPTLRLANLMQLGHNMSVDLYVDEVIQHAKIVVIRILGGYGYWPYGVEQIAEVCRKRGIQLAVLPGDDQPDPELATYSTVGADALHRLWHYGMHGGPANSRNLILYMKSLIAGGDEWQEPTPLVWA